ncbi:hypothetical protein ACFYUJ_27110 [Streptomyces sp. NPDC004520]|uniref:hypothetical protein n=1 Tax=Streptomyces sp. NPDC004520 TaxID=3364702 RepID=UPI0036B9F821
MVPEPADPGRAPPGADDVRREVRGARGHDVGGPAEGGWFVHLVARGKGMGQREQQRARTSERGYQEYVRAAATATGTRGGTGHADRLTKLADPENHGDITAAEYERAKEKVLAG